MGAKRNLHRVKVAVYRVIYEIKDDQDVGKSLLLKIHTGSLLGKAGSVLGLLWALALCGLALSGTGVFWQMYRRRLQATGASRLFWK